MRNRKFKVRFFAILFVLAAVVIAVALLLPTINLQSVFSNNVDTAKSEKNTFSDVKFKSQDKNGREMRVAADSVNEQDVSNFKLNNVTSEFALSEDDTATIVADTTDVVRGNSNQCTLSGNVKLTTKSGLVLETQQSFADFDKNFIHGDTAVIITHKSTNLCGDSYSFDADKRILTLIGHAKGIMNTNVVTSDELTIIFANDNGQMVVKNIEARGNVNLSYEVRNQKYNIRSQHLTALLDDSGNVTEVVSDSFLTVKTETGIIRANSGTFKDGIVKAHGNVAVISDNGDVFGDNATLNIETGEVSINKSSGIVGDGRR